jgi:hypothetical protein
MGLWLRLWFRWHGLLVVEVIEDVLLDRTQRGHRCLSVVDRAGRRVSTSAAIGGGWRDGVIVWVRLRLGLWLRRHRLLVVKMLQDFLLDRPTHCHGRTLRRLGGSLGAGDDAISGSAGDRDDPGRLLPGARRVGDGAVELSDAVGSLEVGG